MCSTSDISRRSMIGRHNLTSQLTVKFCILRERKTIVDKHSLRTLAACSSTPTSRRAPRGHSKSCRHMRCLSQPGEGFPRRPKKRSDWEVGPAFDLSQEQAVCMQLQVMGYFVRAHTQPTVLTDTISSVHINCLACRHFNKMTSPHLIMALRCYIALQISTRLQEAAISGEQTAQS